MIIGSHVSLKSPDFYLGSVKEALSYNANAMMIYTGPPQNTLRKNIKEFLVEDAKKLMEVANIKLKNVIIHAPYIVNLGNDDEEKRNFSIQFLTQEVIRTHQLGASIIVIHPGAYLDAGLEKGIANVADSLNKIIIKTKDYPVYLALETMSGKGTEIGSRFEDFQKMLTLIQEPSRIKICMDTCHIHDANYDINYQFEAIMQEFNEKIGLDKVAVIHINDSKNIVGAKKDRHANIGTGNILIETFKKFINFPAFENIPFILETPHIEGLAPYKDEIALMRSLKNQ